MDGTVDGGTQRVTIASDSTGRVAAVPRASSTSTDRASTCYHLTTASTNATNCKAAAGNVYLIHATNPTSTTIYLRMYNTSSSPTCSSSTGFVETIPVLGTSVNGHAITVGAPTTRA